MDFRFIAPELAALDTLESEVICCSVWQDVRPCNGVAGLCDWRLAGKLSKLMQSGFLEGRPGEVLLLPGRPQFTYDKILIFGAGPRNLFGNAAFKDVTGHMLHTLERLGARVAVVELPGRQCDAIEPDRAAAILLKSVSELADGSYHQTWTLTESVEAGRQITRHVEDLRRQIRRVE